MTRILTESDYQSALDFLVGRINFERGLPLSGRQPFCLDRMRALLARLDNPQTKLRIVHIAGTKGKGSTAAMIASMLTAAGYCVGLYTSPHLDSVEERFNVDGAACSAADFVELINAIHPVVASMDAESGGRDDHRPTYFEMATALALMHFVRRKADWAVLEVGLGGRLDSTNVCDPLVSVITSISFDHTQQLGKTLAAIAREKAGIIKPGVPVISGVRDEEPRAVIEEIADAQNCRLLELGQAFEYCYRPPRHLENADALGRFDFRYRDTKMEWELRDAELRLVGDHQAANAAVALATIAQLRSHGCEVSEAALRRGLADVQWPARVEVLSRAPTIVLDAAHNVASVEAFVRAIQESFCAPRRMLIYGTTCDKDIRGMLAQLIPHFDQIVFTQYVHNPRSVPPTDLQELAKLFSPRSVVLCDDPVSAWQVATDWATPPDLIGITGSVFLAAEMRTAIRAAVADRRIGETSPISAVPAQL